MLHCSTYSRASVTRGPSRQVMYSTLFNIFPRFGYKGSEPPGTVCYTVQHIPALQLQGVRAARYCMLHCSIYSHASVTRGPSRQVMYYTVQHIPTLRSQGVRAARYCMLHCSTYSRASVTRGPSRQVMYSTLFNIFPRFGYKGSEPPGNVLYCSTYSHASVTRGPTRQVMYVTVQHIPALRLQGVRAAR